MSCYFRHIKDILDEAGIEVAYKDCTATWRKLKQQIMGDEQKKQDFIRELKDAVH